ncbi:reverse transcriptase domain-containing protein [Anaerotruncus colihominis]|uniref:reverse transcriptase domain-containing protein n=1 Tax=Anaerotruncus colihominis TaxID=169435 RepID=UPI003D71DB4A
MIKLLCIVRQMLKAQVVLPDGTRITPTKGTPQGGILSPLLSNIVLNELDWWVTSQWEEMPAHYEYKTRQNARGTDTKSHTYRALRRSSLKEMYIVRYADDFKIFCRSRQDAKRAFEATRLWLKDRLGLEISPEKSKVINLKQRYSEFLGFKMKVCSKGEKYVVCSHMSDRAVKQAFDGAPCAVKVACTVLSGGKAGTI